MPVSDPYVALAISPSIRKAQQRVEKLAFLLDDSLRIPFTTYRIGFDALLGLLPGIGDALGFILSVYIILEAARCKLPASTLSRMFLNILLEGILGTIPVFGDVFDAAWKANKKNMRLLEHRLRQTGVGSPADDRTYWLAIFVTVTVLLAFMLVLLLKAAGWLLSHVAGA